MNHVADEALEDMITRRIANTGETRAQARKAILEVIDVRDKNGYHPNANDPSRRGKS